MSLKELQATPQPNSALRSTQKSMSVSKRGIENMGSTPVTDSKAKLKEQAISSLPDSIKKVKEDIKKKIEK